MRHHVWDYSVSLYVVRASGPLWFQRIHLDRQQLHARRLGYASLDLLPYNLQPGLLENALELSVLPTRESAKGRGQTQKPRVPNTYFGTYRVTLLSMSSKTSAPVVLRFSLTTIKPSGLRADLHLSRY